MHPPECPPWLLQQPNILFNIYGISGRETPAPLSSQSMFLEVFSRYTNVYTDGSKEHSRTGISFVCDDHEFSCFIRNKAWTSSAELQAIEASVVYDHHKFASSLHMLQALKRQKLNNPIISTSYIYYVPLLVQTQIVCVS